MKTAVEEPQCSGKRNVEGPFIFGQFHEVGEAAAMWDGDVSQSLGRYSCEHETPGRDQSGGDQTGLKGARPVWFEQNFKQFSKLISTYLGSLEWGLRKQTPKHLTNKQAHICNFVLNTPVWSMPDRSGPSLSCSRLI